jgi:hypothetical protein
MRAEGFNEAAASALDDPEDALIEDLLDAGALSEANAPGDGWRFSCARV